MPQCQWTARSQKPSCLKSTTNLPIVGNGTITYEITANSSRTKNRECPLIVAQQNIPITQALFDGNIPPIAVANVTPLRGTPPLKITANGRASKDSDSDKHPYETGKNNEA